MIHLWAKWKENPQLRFGQFLLSEFPILVGDENRCWNAEIDEWFEELGIEDEEFKF